MVGLKKAFELDPTFVLVFTRDSPAVFWYKKGSTNKYIMELSLTSCKFQQVMLNYIFFLTWHFVVISSHLGVSRVFNADDGSTEGFLLWNIQDFNGLWQLDPTTSTVTPVVPDPPHSSLVGCHSAGKIGAAYYHMVQDRISMSPTTTLPVAWDDIPALQNGGEVCGGNSVWVPLEEYLPKCANNRSVLFDTSNPVGGIFK